MTVMDLFLYYTNWVPFPSRLFNNQISDIQFIDDEVIGINYAGGGRTTHLSNNLTQGYTSPSFKFNENFLINSGWMNEDGSQILPVAYIGDGMQIGSNTLPNVTNYNTVVCNMINEEPLELRGVLNASNDVNIVAAYDNQIYDGTQWVDGYYQSTLVFNDNAMPEVGDDPDGWFLPAPGMEVHLASDVLEMERDGETIKYFWVWFKKIGATGVEMVDVAMEVSIKSAESVGIGIEEINEYGLRMYPNPVKDKLFLELDKHAIIRVYNSLGQKVLRQEYTKNNNYINLSKLDKGYYVIKIETDFEIISKKVVKE